MPLEPPRKPIDGHLHAVVGDVGADHGPVEQHLALGLGRALDPRVWLLVEHHSSSKTGVDVAIQSPDLVHRQLARLLRHVAPRGYVYIHEPSLWARIGGRSVTTTHADAGARTDAPAPLTNLGSVGTDYRERVDMAQKTATTRSRTAAKKSTKAPAKKSGGTAKPVDRLDDAIAAAQDALKDLRGDLSRGRRDLVKDMDKTLKDARTNLRRVRKTLVEDLGEVGSKLSGGNGAKRKPAAKKPAARKPAAAKSKAKPRAKK